MSGLASIQCSLMHRFAYLLSKRSNQVFTEKLQIKHGFSYCTQRTFYKLCLNSQNAMVQSRPSQTVCEWQLLHHQRIMILSNKNTCRWLSESLSKGSPSRGQRAEEGQSLISDETVNGLADQILEHAKSKDVRAASLQHKAVVNMVKDWTKTGCSQLQIVNLLSSRLWLLQDHNAVMAIVETLKQQGLSLQLTLAFLESLPPEYCMQEKLLVDIPDIINTSLQQLRDLGFSHRNLPKLIEASPRVLLESSKTLRYTISRLKGLFTKTDALKVVSGCPVVFSQSWDETHKNFDYAYFTMGYSQPQIVESNVLACPLKKLQDRHTFLDRVGFFTEVKKKNDPRLNPNPPLKFVVNASDGEFASKFGDMSEQEYGTFLAMRELEREEANDWSDSDSNPDCADSDSNSDSTESDKD